MGYPSKSIEPVLAKAEKDAEIIAVLLFGSQARGEATLASDADLCLILRPGNYDALTLFEKRLNYLKETNADVHIFSQLPLYIRRRVLKEGKILLCHDEDALYEVAFKTAQAFEDFKHIYYSYLEQIAHV
jgi:predicted nucleotidyltransferase